MSYTTSALEKDMLKCNLSGVNDFPEWVLDEENKLYMDGVGGWRVYECVSTLSGWKSEMYEYPSIHLFHRKVVDTVKSLGINSVCEAGAGAGVVAKYVYASQKDLNFTCLEGSDKHLSQMRENFNESSGIISPKVTVNVNIVKGILQSIPFKDNYFDLVYTCSVMMHVPFLMVPKAVLELSRITRRYVLHVENKNDIINTVCMGRQRFPLNRLCIDYERMYKMAGVNTLKYEVFKDPHSESNCIYFLGEKVKHE